MKNITLSSRTNWHNPGGFELKAFSVICESAYSYARSVLPDADNENLEEIEPLFCEENMALPSSDITVRVYNYIQELNNSNRDVEKEKFEQWLANNELGKGYLRKKNRHTAVSPIIAARFIRDIQPNLLDLSSEFEVSFFRFLSGESTSFDISKISEFSIKNYSGYWQGICRVFYLTEDYLSTKLGISPGSLGYAKSHDAHTISHSTFQKVYTSLNILSERCKKLWIIEKDLMVLDFKYRSGDHPSSQCLLDICKALLESRYDLAQSDLSQILSGDSKDKNMLSSFFTNPRLSSSSFLPRTQLRTTIALNLIPASIFSTLAYDAFRRKKYTENSYFEGISVTFYCLVNNNLQAHTICFADNEREGIPYFQQAMQKLHNICAEISMKSASKISYEYVRKFFQIPITQSSFYAYSTDSKKHYDKEIKNAVVVYRMHVAILDAVMTRALFMRTECIDALEKHISDSKTQESYEHYSSLIKKIRAAVELVVLPQ